MNYEEWLLKSAELNKIVDEMGKHWNMQYKSGDFSCGFIPYSITSSQKYRECKANFDKAFKALRDFNGLKCYKEYQKRKHKEKRAVTKI
jgi:hypothetical protein